MKKHLLIVLAAVGLAACTQEEFVALPQSDAIAFDGGFVDNATRAAVDPSTTTAKIEDFNVWGFMTDNTGTVFSGDKVEKGSNGWAYANTQYWAPARDYFFAAVSPAGSANWSLAVPTTGAFNPGVLSFTNADGSEDLLYATASVTTPDYAALANNGMEKVKFQFHHLLSKVKFTFANGFATDNVTVKISNVKMTAPASAKIDLNVADYAWVLDDVAPLTLEFGDVPVLEAKKNDESAVERLSIPAGKDYTYNITFGIDVYMGAQPALHVDKTSTVTAVALEIGKAYNFTAEINPENLELPSIEFDVVAVDDWAQPTVDVEHPVVATLNDAPYTSLQAAINAAVAGVNTITLISDVKENVTIKQAQDINLVIEGNGKSYDGVLTINGDARSTGDETLTIQNLNFKTSHYIDTKESEWIFITAPTNVNGKYNYAHNVTIDRCTFENKVAGILRVGSANFQQAYNIVMKNCKATNMHSLFQAQSIDNNVTVENVEVVASKNGVSFGNTKNATLKNAKIEAIEYGVRADGNRAGSSLTAEKVTIAANQPIIVRKNTAPYSVNLVGTENTLTPGDFYHVVFTTGSDDAAYVAPAAANYAITGADGLKMFPTNANEWVSTAEDLNALLADKVTDIKLAPKKFEGKYTILANGTTIEGRDGTVVDCINLNGKDNVTLKNIEFNAAGAQMSIDGQGKERQLANVISGDTNHMKGSRNLLIEGCTFSGSFANGGAAIAFTDRSRKTGNSGDITIKKCTFESMGAYYHIYGYYTGYNAFNIEENIFKTKSQGDAINLLRYNSDIPVVLKGNKFEAITGMADAMYVTDPDGNTLPIDASDNTFAN